MPRVTDLASARGHVGIRTNQGSRIDYITEKSDLHRQMGMRRGSGTRRWAASNTSNALRGTPWIVLLPKTWFFQLCMIASNLSWSNSMDTFNGPIVLRIHF